MGEMFGSLEDAVSWLYVNGWRQTDDGEWRKGARVAEVRRSPANDGAVSVVFRKAR